MISVSVKGILTVPITGNTSLLVRYWIQGKEETDYLLDLEKGPRILLHLNRHHYPCCLRGMVSEWRPSWKHLLRIVVNGIVVSETSGILVVGMAMLETMILLRIMLILQLG